MGEKNFYELLECTQTSSDEDIKRQYRKLALKFHPDKNDSSSNINFDKLKKAYETLSNEIKRREYDIELLRKKSKESDMIVTESVSITEINKDESYSYYDCRCGGQFVISELELDDLFVNNNLETHVQCDSCSLFLHITGIQRSENKNT